MVEFCWSFSSWLSVKVPCVLLCGWKKNMYSSSRILLGSQPWSTKTPSLWRHCLFLLFLQAPFQNSHVGSKDFTMWIWQDQDSGHILSRLEKLNSFFFAPGLAGWQHQTTHRSLCTLCFRSHAFVPLFTLYSVSKITDLSFKGDSPTLELRPGISCIPLLDSIFNLSKQSSLRMLRHICNWISISEDSIGT